VPNVALVEEHSISRARTLWGTVLLQGVSPDTRIYQRQMVAGSWVGASDDDAMVISDLVAHKTHLQVGDTMMISLPAGSKDWRIVGVAQDPTAGPNLIGTAFVTTQGLADLTEQPAQEASTYLIQAHDRSQGSVSELAVALDQRLTAEGFAPSIVTHPQDDQATQTQSQILSTLLYAVAFVVALGGLLGLANTLATSVLEHRREIGILRSMGASGWRVSSVFWVEGIALALIAWGVSVLVGIPGAIAFLLLISRVFLPLDFAFNPLALPLVLACLHVVTTIATWAPALSAARMRIATILRYE
jgi:putative ABC transport system permease protein